MVEERSFTWCALYLVESIDQVVESITYSLLIHIQPGHVYSIVLYMVTTFYAAAILYYYYYNSPHHNDNPKHCQ